MSELRDQLQTTLRGSYTIERELGGGGMSRVFVAEETALGRRVVVKVLPPDLVAGVNVERFNREILVAARLQHPHIVPLHSAGEMDGVPFYTMPFVEGESLRSLLARTGPLPMTEAIGVLRDVAKALAYAHERKVVHRDIKPDNVLLSGGSATVTDFGIAKAIAAARTEAGFGAQPTLTQVGTSIGTPAYMSPEQSAGDPLADHRADLYSFGCMAYEVLAGRPPFVAKTPQRLLAAHMGEAPEHVKTHRPDTPDALAELVMRCLEKDANARPQHASELVQVLETVTSGGGHVAMPPILLGGTGMIKKALLAYVVAFVFVAALAKAAIVAVGLPDWVFPGALLVMALGLPVILFTGYVHHATRRAMTKTPTFTPGGSSSAVHGTMATIAMKASPHVSWRRTWLGGAVALGTFVLLIGAYMLLRALGIGPFGSLIGRGTLARNERLLVGDFTTAASDSALGSAVTEAFRTALGESRSMSVVPATAMREALRRMQKAADTKVDFAVAREMATRDGIRGVVVGEMVGVGGSYAIAVRLVSPRTGDELASFRETARDQKEILSALDRLAKQLRARVGESLRSVQAAPPLERVTTSSLEALQKYVQSLHVVTVEGDFARAASLMEEAIALDTGFAMAYRRLAVEYSNRGQPDRAMDLLQRAYDHRDRLSETERYVLMGTYYQFGPKQDIAKAIAAYESLTELQPDFVGGYNNAANSYRYQRNFQRAYDGYKQAVTIGPAIPVHFTNLIGTDILLGKREEAWRVLASFDSAFPGNPASRLTRARLLVLRGAYDSSAAIDRELIHERPNDLPTHAAAAAELAAIARSRGRLAEAAKLEAEAAQVNAQRGVRQAALARDVTEATVSAWFLNDRVAAVMMIDRALAQTPLDSLHQTVRPYGNIVFAYSAAGRPDKARAVYDAFERGAQQIVTFQDDRERHRMLADIALAQKKYDEAVREYRASDVGWCVTCALPGLGRAYDLSGQSDSAIAVFERYVNTGYLARTAGEAAEPSWYLAGIHKRLGELYEDKRDTQNATSHYLKFVDLWKDADPALQHTVAEVRGRLAKLRDTEGSRTKK